MRIGFARRDRMGNVFRALHRIDDQHEVADPLAAIRPQVTLPG
jgi:hypothetical protein